MSNIYSIAEFLEPVSVAQVSMDESYLKGQMGHEIAIFEEELPDLDEVHIVLLGCNEYRGSGIQHGETDATTPLRHELYKLYYWHSDIKIADVGNVKKGATYQDTYAALRMVVNELIRNGKTVIILGGSHDLTTAQYAAYGDSNMRIEATCIDALIDLNESSYAPAHNFLMDMLTCEPNYLRHYNHIGFQSYFIHPYMLETLDKLRFDCFRVGHVKESIEEMEPVLRNTHLLSFDISSMAHAFAPSQSLSPNGFTGEEACVLMRYAGMSPFVNTIGLYGYLPKHDVHSLTAKQLSQMIWYILDGRSRGVKEAGMDERESFNEYYTTFAEVQTVFLQSKKTSRWWMQLPNKQFIACSYKDYLLASSDEIPERWLRAQER